MFCLVLYFVSVFLSRFMVLGWYFFTGDNCVIIDRISEQSTYVRTKNIHFNYNSVINSIVILIVKYLYTCKKRELYREYFRLDIIVKVTTHHRVICRYLMK